MTPRRALVVQVGRATGGQRCHRGREQGSRGGPARCSSPGHSNAAHRSSRRRRLLPHGGSRLVRPPAPRTQCPESELRNWHRPPGPPQAWSPPGHLPGTGSPGSCPGPTACGPRMPGAGWDLHWPHLPEVGRGGLRGQQGREERREVSWPELCPPKFKLKSRPSGYHSVTVFGDSVPKEVRKVKGHRCGP